MRVIVVGAGVLGTMHAWQAAERGHEVVHIEREEQARGASVRNFGLVWVGGRADGPELESALRGRELWERIGGLVPELGFRAAGSLTVVTNEAELAVASAACERPDAAARGLRLLSPDEVRAVNPALRGESVLGALWCAKDAAVEPRPAQRALQRALRRHSGGRYTFLGGREVREVLCHRRAAVRDDHADVHEGGSGEMVQRTVRERNNTQADVMATLRFIQQAERKGLLTPYEPRGSERVPPSEKSARGTWTGVVNNYFGFVRNSEELSGDSAPRTWGDLLKPRYRDALQYSTPGGAGDGTAMLVKAMHDFGGKKPAMEYFRELQKNNVGPSSSTSKLAPKVDKGELLVANGDVQMNYAQSKSMPNLDIWFPAADAADGTGQSAKPSTFSLPYAAGLLRDAPSAENGKKLLDFLLSERAQREVPSVAGGFPVRDDVEPSGEDAAALEKLLDGVEVFRPDWDRVERNLDSHIDSWKEATGN